MQEFCILWPLIRVLVTCVLISLLHLCTPTTTTHARTHTHDDPAQTQAQQLLPTVMIMEDPLGGVHSSGATVTLTCVVLGAAEVEWRHRGEVVVPDVTRTVSGSSLTITSLSVELTGGYCCLASNSLYTVTSPTAVVELAGELTSVACDFEHRHT